MKGACFPFFLEHYHGMIGKDQSAYFRETPSGRIILARFDPEKAKKREASDAQKAVQQRLKQAHQQAIEALKETDSRHAIEAEFKAQSKYATILGYATAKYYKILG